MKGFNCVCIPLNPDLEAIFAKRLASRLGRNPELPPIIAARLEHARTLALSTRTPVLTVKPDGEVLRATKPS